MFIYIATPCCKFYARKCNTSIPICLICAHIRRIRSHIHMFMTVRGGGGGRGERRGGGWCPFHAHTESVPFAHGTAPVKSLYTTILKLPLPASGAVLEAVSGMTRARSQKREFLWVLYTFACDSLCGNFHCGEILLSYKSTLHSSSAYTSWI